MRIFMRLILVLFFWAQASASSSELNEKLLRIAFIQEWGSFSPVNNQLASSDAVMSFLIRKVVARSAQGEALADVADRIPKLKGRTALWILKDNAKWGDGTPITCADWHFAWEVGSNPNVSTIAREDYSKIEKMTWEQSKPKVCTVLYRKPNWYDRDLPPLLPSHLEKAIYEKYKDKPEGYDRNSNYNTNPTLPGLYNGPYRVSEFKLGSHAVFVINPFYFGKKAQIEKVILKHIADTSALKAHLVSKEVDMIAAVGLPPDTAFLFDREFQNKKLPYRVHFQSSSIFQGLFFNLEHEALKDAKVREALSLAIDKDLIIKAFFEGRLRAAHGIIPPMSPAFQSPKAEPSIERANAILEKAQWKLSSQGIREKAGRSLSFVFKTSAGIKVLELIQQQICESFKSIGVSCVIKNEPPRILLGSSIPHGDFDFAMFGQPVPPDSSMNSYFSSKEIPSAANSWAGANIFHINSKKMDELLIKFDSETRSSQRAKIIQNIEADLMSNHYFVPLYHRQEAIVVPNQLKGLSDSFEGTSFNLPENWTIERGD